MSDAGVQSYGNHARWLVPWHFFVLPVMLANFIIKIVGIVRSPGLPAVWEAIVAMALLVGLGFARWMTLRVQDRQICHEETQRLERLLSDRAVSIERVTPDQLIGIRFASDAEVPHLVERILSGELATRDDVKRAVQHWRPDHARA